MVLTAEMTYTLTDVIELRTWEEAFECYMDIPVDQRIACAHCGKLCQKVYEVTRDQDGHTFLIGPGCCKKNLFGWEPEKATARRLEKEADKRAKSKAHQRLVEMSMPIAETVKALAIPEIVCLGAKDASAMPWYGILGSRAKVLCREGLTSERRQSCVESWQDEQIWIRVGAITENPKLRRKIQDLALSQLRWGK